MKTVRELLDSGVLNTPATWSEELKITHEDWQKLHQWLGSIWREELSVVEVYAKAVEVVPDMTVVGKFFNRPMEVIEFCVGIFVDAQEYAEKFTTDQLPKMKELQIELMKSDGIERLRREVMELMKYVEKVGFRVRHRIIKPDHAEAMEKDYEYCDLQDMVFLLPEAEEKDKDSFYNHWDKLLKEAQTSELLDVLPEILRLGSKHAVARWDEAFKELTQRAPFEQIYAHLSDFVVITEKYGQAIDKTSEGEYPEDYMAFKEWVWEMFKRLHSLLATFNPRMQELLKDGREDAEKISGYRP